MIAPLPDPGIDRPARIPHVAALDGLRGIAVAGVLLFHAGHLRGGFLGVDLFFTLSGFLITSLLLVEREGTGAISLVGFWGRRARRLLPAMVVVVAASAVLARAVLRADELDRVRGQALASLAYVANWTEIARASDYFALFDSATPLDHMWSLAIEEQFYLAWPLLVLLACRVARRPRAGVRFLVAAGTVASVAATWWVLRDPEGVTRAYYGTDTRATSILVGAGLATITAGSTRFPGAAEHRLARAAPLALVALIGTWFVVDGAEVGLYRWGLAGHAALTAAVIGAVTGPAPGVLGRALSARPLVRLGLISYGLYLWHWPVYVALDADRTGTDGWTLTAARLAVSLVLAELSFRFLESPVRAQRIRFPRPALTALGTVATAAVVVVALTRSDTDVRLPSVEPLAADPSGAGDAGPASPPAAPTLTSVTLVGDSQAFTLAFHAPAAELGIRVDNAANLGCGLSARTIVMHGEHVERERCVPILDELPALVDGQDADVVAVLAGVWEASDQVVDGDVVSYRDPRWAELLRRDFLAAVGPLTRSHRVVLLTTPCFAEGTQREEYATEDIDARIAAVNRVLTAVAGDAGMAVVDLAGHLCPRGRPRSRVDGHVVRPDGVHFDEVGARVVWPWLAGELQRTMDGHGGAVPPDPAPAPVPEPE